MQQETIPMKNDMTDTVSGLTPTIVQGMTFDGTKAICSDVIVNLNADNIVSFCMNVRFVSASTPLLFSMHSTGSNAHNNGMEFKCI